MGINIQELVNDAGKLVSFPDVYIRLEALMQDERFSLDDVEKFIRQDPGLTLQLLKVANSPFYGLSYKVDSITQAITILGAKQLKQLVLTSSASKMLTGIPNDLFRMEDFWNHSVLCGLAAQYLANQCRDIEGDFAFVAGLLHDIGQLILFNKLPGQTRVALELTMDKTEKIELYQAEQRLFGFDHAELGGELMRTWHLPERLQEAVACHHRPDKAKLYPVEAAIIYLANYIAAMVSVNDISKTKIQQIDTIAWELTGLTPEVVEPAITYARDKLAEVKSALTLVG